MTIYVDPNFSGKIWCHMVTDGPVDELHAFARRIALKPRWFQPHPKPHYDISPFYRERAIALGAKEVSFTELARVVADRKPSHSSGGI